MSLNRPPISRPSSSSSTNGIHPTNTHVSLFKKQLSVEDMVSPISLSDMDENYSDHSSDQNYDDAMEESAPVVDKEQVGRNSLDDEIDVDPEKLMDITVSILDSNITPKRNKLSTKSPVVDESLGETPFFQEHILYDEEEKPPIEQITKCFSCICDLVPWEIRTRFEYCGKKLCAPRIVVSVGLFILFFGVAVSFLLLSLILLGMKVFDYPVMVLDPNAISFIHRNCCTIENVREIDISEKLFACDMLIKFPVIGFSNKSNQENEWRGYDLDCAKNSFSTFRAIDFHYTGNRVSLFHNNSIVDCYTNKEENVVTLLEPYSYMYYLFNIFGITGIIISFSSFCFAFCSFVICCIALRKRKKGSKRCCKVWCC